MLVWALDAYKFPIQDGRTDVEPPNLAITELLSFFPPLYGEILKAIMNGIVSDKIWKLRKGDLKKRGGVITLRD